MRFISSESPAALFPCGRLFWFLEDGGHAMAAAPLPLQSPCVLLFRIRAHDSDQAFSSVTISQERLACLGGLFVPRSSLVFCRIRMCARADPLLNTGACALGDAPLTRTRRRAPADSHPEDPGPGLASSLCSSLAECSCLVGIRVLHGGHSGWSPCCS